MSDSYLQFYHSWEITEEEGRWLDNFLRAPSPRLKKILLEAQDFEQGEEGSIEDWEEMWPFDWAVWWQGSKVEFDIWSEASGDASVAAIVIQRFLRRFRPDEKWGISYADYDLPVARPHNSAGGAILISASRITNIHTMDWLRDNGAMT